MTTSLSPWGPTAPAKYTSLAQVTLQNRRALYLLMADKGGTCFFLREDEWGPSHLRQPNSGNPGKEHATYLKNS
jgi:hypothetical protein